LDSGCPIADCVPEIWGKFESTLKKKKKKKFIVRTKRNGEVEES